MPPNNMVNPFLTETSIFLVLLMDLGKLVLRAFILAVPSG